ncbi:hypothetical protein BH10ACT1_BH10ACT1_36170 [soil metagenome]
MRAPIRGRAGAAVAALALVPLLVACGDEPAPPAAPLPSPALAAVLSPSVGPDALSSVTVAVRELSLRCSDLPSARSAAMATLRAGEQAGLARHDDRWSTGADQLIAGVAGVPKGEACTPRLAGWLAGTATVPTIPVEAPATTTTLVVGIFDVMGPPIRPVALATYRKVRPGMSLAEVRRLFGSPGSRVDVSIIGQHRDERFEWPAAGGSFAAVTVQLRDGRVVVSTSTGRR